MRKVTVNWFLAQKDLRILKRVLSSIFSLVTELFRDEKTTEVNTNVFAHL